jgi:hypothetical protein
MGMGTYLASHFAHLHLLFHLDVVELLAPRERPGHAQEQGRAGDDPEGAAAVAEDSSRRVGDSRGAVGNGGARRGRDDVAEGVEALGQRLVRGIVVRVDGDLRVCFQRMRQSVMRSPRSLVMPRAKRTGIRVVFVILLGAGLALLKVLVLNLCKLHHCVCCYVPVEMSELNRCGRCALGCGSHTLRCVCLMKPCTRRIA